MYFPDLQFRGMPMGDRARTFAIRALVLLWRIVRLPVSLLLRTLEPVVRIGCAVIVLPGILISVVLELSASAPHFPFWGALAFFLGCGVLPFAYRYATALLSR